MKALNEDSEPARRIKKLAVRITVYDFVMSLVLCLIGGVGWLGSLVEATIAAAGGFVAWALYREISRRYDGLAIFVFVCNGPMRHVMDKAKTGMNSTMVVVIFLIVSAPLMGLCCRNLPNPKKPPARDEFETGDPWN
jgi:hypothetical protein